MRKTLRAFVVGRESDEGQAIVLIAITLLAMLMIVGVAIDAGQVYSAKRQMQEAADAAAYAAAVTLYEGGSQAEAITAARTDAITNGFDGACVGGLATAGACTDSTTNTTVTVQTPTTAPYNNTTYMQIDITRQVRTALVPAQSAITRVSAHAVAGSTTFNNQWALVVLDTNSTSNAFTVGSGASVAINGGGIQVNSVSATAANNSAPTSAWTVTCPSTNPCTVSVSGNVSGTWPAASPGTPNYFNGVVPSAPQIPDPFAGFPKPSTGGLILDRAVFSTSTIGTGIYDYDITGKSLCHGIYILKGAGSGPIYADTSSTDPVTLTPCDGKVFIFNTTTTYPASGGTCSAIHWDGSSTVSLGPMSTGVYANMLLYQDNVCTVAMTVGGGGGIENATGTIYLPTATFIGKSGAQVAGGQIVAYRLDFSALSSNINIQFVPGNVATPLLPRLAK